MKSHKLLLSVIVYTFFINLNLGFSKDMYLHYGVKDGLPSENIFAIEQDNRGYIWIATEAGLSRFNGQEFLNFSIKDGLYRNEIVNITEDKLGNLWLNLSGPFSYYKDGEFKTIANTKNDINWNFEVLVNAKKNTWIATKNRLHLLNQKKDSLIENNITRSVNADPSLKTQLVGSYNDTCLIYKNFSLLFTNNEMIVDSIYLKNINVSDSVKRLIFCFAYPNLFYISDSAINVINIQTKKNKIIAENIKPGNRKLLKIDNKLLYKSGSPGFTEYELDKANQVIKKTKQIERKLISNFYVDSEKNLWVCSFDNGLYFYPNYFEKTAELVKINAFKKRPLNLIKIFDQEIWIASRKNLVTKINSKDTITYSLPFIKQYANCKINDIARLGKDTLLFSTDIGFFIFKNDMFKHIIKTAAKKLFTNGNKVLLNNFMSVVETSKKHLVENQSKKDHLVFLEKRDSINYKKIVDGRTYTSLIDQQNNYWIASYAMGLTKINNTDTIYFNQIDRLFNASIIDIIDLNEDSIAIATSGEGIIIINTQTNTYKNIDNKSNLISNAISALAWHNQRLFVATDKGLSVISNLNSTKPAIVNVDQHNGLMFNHINDIAVTDSSIHLVGQNGYQVIPSHNNLYYKKTDGKILIEHIKVNGRIVNNHDLEELKESENQVEFKFDLLQFSSNSNVRFAYKIKEIDDEWHITTNRTANYSNLEHGEYTFLVGLIRYNNAKEIEQINKIEFCIKPHYTRSNWFKLICALLVLSLIYLALNVRQKFKLRSLVEEQTQLLNNKIDELASINVELKRSNQDLIDFAYACSHDLKTPLRNINSFTELLYKKHKKNFSNDEQEFYNYIDFGIKKMYQIINDLIEHAKVSHNKKVNLINFLQLVETYQIEIHELLKLSNTELIIESQLPIVVYNLINAKQLLANLITNGIKYNKSEKPVISIGHTEYSNHYKFYIKDNGIGIDKEYHNKIFKIFTRLHSENEFKGTGIGLAICKRIVEKFGGEIWVESTLGQGSTFYFTILKTLPSAYHLN